MKTLEKGRPQKGWAKEFTCTGKGNEDGGCGAKLLVEQGDLYRTQSSCRDETNRYYTFQCQECGVETDLPESERITFGVPTKADWLARKGKSVEDYYNK